MGPSRASVQAQYLRPGTRGGGGVVCQPLRTPLAPCVNNRRQQNRLSTPSCFCCRHNLDLQLKALIFYVLDAAVRAWKITDTTLFEKQKAAMKKHGLKAPWEMLQSIEGQIDSWATSSIWALLRGQSRKSPAVV
jgi:hypothetical protein